MITIHRYALCALILVCCASCAGMPKIKPPKFSQRYYSYTVLLAPEKLGNSPQLDLALSLLRMEYPKDQAQAFHDMLYGQTSLDAYKDLVINEQRKNYRGRAADMPSNGDSTASSNWRYTEKFSIKKIYDRGIVIERNLETYSGGTNSGRITQYYNIEIDTDGFRQLSLDDLFANYQEDQKLRDIVYEELREYSNLGSGQPLSQGIYLKNQPELTFNFFITDDGLGLHWDPAQIAPYSHGSIQINLPWYMVRSLMLYTGIELLAKFNIYLFNN